jgi:transcriptional regulator with XRE-family HTH domain
MTYSTHLLRHLRFTIGQNIQRQRVQNKWPLRKLARLACIDEYRLDQFELGKNEIHLNELFRIACVLKVEIAQLMC